MKIWLIILIAVVVLAAGLALGFILGVLHRKKVAEAAIGSAEREANKIINDAIAVAEAKKKEAVVEAKDEIHKQRSETERELRERRNEVQRMERRINQKEESLDKKSDNLEKKDEILNEKIQTANSRLEEIEKLKKSELDILEKISGFTKEQAKEHIIKKLDDELDREKALKIKEVERTTKDESDKIAKEIVSTAIQRCAAEHVAEAAVSVVPLPSDEMKGRIIGREGRNVRALETITGVDLIIDDTPEAITISSFDPVRREIAKISIERLVADGRIHPARIEDTYEKAKREVEATIKQTGERAVMEAGVNNVHPEIVKLLGKLKYRASYGQNVLKHSLEVSRLAGLMAEELGSDVKIAKRAGLLHDIGKAVDHEFEGSHVDLGVEFAKKYKESEAVLHAIKAHHGEIEPKTIAAVLVQAADAISAARPGARREDVQNYFKRLQKLEEIGDSFEGVERSFAIQAGREIRIMVKPELVNDDKMVLLARDIAQKIEKSVEYPGQIKVHLIRESRTFDYAK